MFFKQKKPKAGEFDYEVARIQRMLDFVKETGKPLNAPNVEAIICNDCVVILDIKDDAGEKVSMCVVKDFRSIPFSLNFTPEQAERFNGGSGVRSRNFGG